MASKIVAISSLGRCGHILRGLAGLTDGSRDHEFRGDSRGRPRFFGAGCHVWWSLQWCCRCGNVENCGRGAVALRGVVCGETRQVYFRAELGCLEGTPLCPCLIQVLPWVQYTRHTAVTSVPTVHTSAHLYLEGFESSYISPLFYRYLSSWLLTYGLSNAHYSTALAQGY